MPISLEELDMLPARVSSRKGTLAVNGGDLYSMYEIDRIEDPYYRSRLSGRTCRKDWQINGTHGYDMRRARRQILALMGK